MTLHVAFQPDIGIQPPQTPSVPEGVLSNHTLVVRLCVRLSVCLSVCLYVSQRPLISFFPKLSMKLGVNVVKKVTWPEF